MGIKKEISEINVFNDLFYKTCMYAPLFTGINYAGGNVLPFLANDFFTYGYNDEINQLYPHNIQVNKEFDLIRDMGIVTEVIEDSDDYVEEIKKAIDDDIPVFVPLDRYYWNNKKFNAWQYKKRHTPHFFLVCGYDENDMTFNVVDVNESGHGAFIDTINCDELIQCYISYCEVISQLKMFKIYKSSSDIDMNRDISKEEYVRIYKDNFIEKESEILDGIENIKKAIDYYKSSFNEAYLKEDMNSITRPFSFIERAKTVQMYQVYCFFGNNEMIFDTLKAITNHMNILKSALLKAVITQKVDEEVVSYIVEQLDSIYKLELDYLSQLKSLMLGGE